MKRTWGQIESLRVRPGGSVVCVSRRSRKWGSGLPAWPPFCFFVCLRRQQILPAWPL